MLNYLLQVGICWTVFYLLYAFWLRRETFFQLNRWYLLATLSLGLLLPALDFSFWPEVAVEGGTVAGWLQPITITIQHLEHTVDTIVVSSEGQSPVFSWTSFLLLIYFVGAFFFLVKLLLGLNQLRQLYRQSEVESRTTYQLVRTSEIHSPFSFFQLLFWSKRVDLNPKEEACILRHELAHINQKHSLDILLAELFGVVFWCLPPVHYYKKSLRTVHEYLADAAVYDSSPKKQYGQLLLRQAQSGMQPALAHPIFHSQLKQRIIMMSRNKSSRKALIKYFSLLPLAALMFFAFSTTDKNLLNSEEELSISSFFSDPDPFDPAKVNEQLAAILIKMEALNTFEDREKVYQYFNEKYQHLQILYPENSEEIGAIAQRWIDKTNAPILMSAGEKFPEPKFTETKSGIGFKVVEEMPRFPGCEDQTGEQQKLCAQKKMLVHIYSNVKYPDEARDNDIQGTVVARFMIDEKGNIEDPKITRGIGGGCDEEVLRVIKTMPLWIPGKHKGKAVKVEYNLPIKFKLEGEAKEKVAEKADRMPRFPGCEGEATEAAKKKCSMNKMISFLGENLKYPKDAKDTGVEGVVLVKFIIDKEGNIRKPHTLKSIGFGCDEEVLRVVKKMISEVGPWTPGQMENGDKVSVYYKLPVSFKLEGKDREAIKDPIKSLTLNNFKAFPNPADDQLNLQFEATAGPLKINLKNINGQELANIEIQDFDGHYEGNIATDKASPGTLILSIQQGEKIFVQKILIQR